jgi:SSS family solute:Na+ symporter
LVKIPMQFFILLIGVLVFTFYQFHQSPIFFNKVEVSSIQNSEYKEDFNALEKAYVLAHTQKQVEVNKLVEAIHSEDEQAINTARTNVQEADKKSNAIRKEATALMQKNNPKADVNDTNYIFLNFITTQLPIGVVGLLIAIIFLASMGSMASGLNSLASTTIIDFYKRLFKKEETDKSYLSASRWTTVIWGLFCIMVAFYASRVGNLIEAVNILGSLFYGTILGIFLVAFYMKRISGTAVFYAALFAEAFIVYAWITDLTAFLWLNVIGCLLVMAYAYCFQLILNKRKSV